VKLSYKNNATNLQMHMVIFDINKIKFEYLERTITNLQELVQYN
jgi:hypothetical protein